MTTRLFAEQPELLCERCCQHARGHDLLRAVDRAFANLDLRDQHTLSLVQRQVLRTVRLYLGDCARRAA